MSNNEKIFSFNPNCSHNACVGGNGAPHERHYINGFTKAALLLLERVLNDEPDSYADELIYPICFNIRHALELQLKQFSADLSVIAKYKGVSLEVNRKKIHDINSLWRRIQELAIKLDPRFTSHLRILDPFICEIGTLDPTGQTFRYPSDTSSKQHLVESGGIFSCKVIESQFKQMNKHLSALQRCCQELISEYSLGSHTKILSRKQLFDIAKRLPDFSQWSENNDFTQCKVKVREDFGISNSELSKSIELIKHHYEMSNLIGISLPLRAISIEQLKMIFDYWTQFHSQHKTTFISLSHIVERLTATLSIEAIADLHALYYFGIDLQYSEYYIDSFEREKNNVKYIKDNKTEVATYLRTVFCKRNLIEFVCKSLVFLRYPPPVGALSGSLDFHADFSSPAYQAQLCRPSYAEFC